MAENHISTEAKKVLENIIGNYKSLEESIVSQLSLSNTCHGYTTGASRETIWLQLFEQIIPKKFQIEQSVFIIDSEGRISKEVDLAIIDHMYTPYIFHYGKLKFVPIEAVAAVIECKSTKVEQDKIELWHKSIETLKTSRNSIVRMASGVVVNGTTYSNGKEFTTGTQTSTRPIRIFCGFKSGNGQGFLEKLFDFIIIAKEENGEKCIQVSAKENNMQEWYKELNHYGNEKDSSIIENNILKNFGLKDLKIEAKGSKEISLLTLNFQLNQLLMLLNNPILFPHQSYAEMFKNALEKSDS